MGNNSRWSSRTIFTLLLSAVFAATIIAGEEVEVCCAEWSSIINLSTGTESGKVGYYHYSDDYGGFANETAQAIAVDTRGNIYIADTYNSRVQIFDPNGVFVSAFSLTDKHDIDSGGNGYNICIGKDNYLYVSEINMKGKIVGKFDLKGRLIHSFGQGGEMPGCFWHADQIEADSKGNVYIYDSNLERIQKFDKKGNFVRILDCSGYFAINENDNICLMDKKTAKVVFYDTKGEMDKPIKTLDAPFSKGGVVMKIDKYGNIYIAGEGKIKKISSDGSLVGEMTMLPRSGNMVRSLVIDDGGNIFVAESDYDLENRIFFKVRKYIWQ